MPYLTMLFDSPKFERIEIPNETTTGWVILFEKQGSGIIYNVQGVIETTPHQINAGWRYSIDHTISDCLYYYSSIHTITTKGNNFLNFKYILPSNADSSDPFIYNSLIRIEYNINFLPSPIALTTRYLSIAYQEGK